MTSTETQIADNLCRVRERIASACARCRRDASSVRLVAVTKYAELDWVRVLVEEGVTDFGESRPQQLVDRETQISRPVQWHLIGHLQRNKARRVLPLAALIHSVDTFRLLSSLERLSGELALRPRLLLEVNLSGESQKHGFSIEMLLDGWEQVVNCQLVQVVGLMTMAPLVEAVEQTRPVFRRLRELRDRLQEMSPPSLRLPELSMGMSRDFDIAIEEGSTIVRVGSSLFEGLET
jgi:hypothetical protein